MKIIYFWSLCYDILAGLVLKGSLEYLQISPSKFQPFTYLVLMLYIPNGPLCYFQSKPNPTTNTHPYYSIRPSLPHQAQSPTSPLIKKTLTRFLFPPNTTTHHCPHTTPPPHPSFSQPYPSTSTRPQSPFNAQNTSPRNLQYQKDPLVPSFYFKRP